MPAQMPPVVNENGLWFEDLYEGYTFTTGSHEVTVEEIIAFAQRFDPQPFHTDADAATASLFGTLVASGWHTAAMSMRLVIDSFPVATGVIGGQGEIAWPSATLPGDILRAECVVESLRDPGPESPRASGWVKNTTTNQHGETRYISRLKAVLWKDPARREMSMSGHE